MTNALGYPNTFTRSPLDRGGDQRNDPVWLAARQDDPAARALVLWQGKVLIEHRPPDDRIATLPLAVARGLLPIHEVFLGFMGDRPVFAVELGGDEDVAGLVIPGSGYFATLRDAAGIVPSSNAAMAGAAQSLFENSRRAAFCGSCGQSTQQASGGWRRVCTACGAETYPRVDPVAIMLPVYEGGDEPRCLVGRQATWPAGRFSALAGFIEPGESIEEACAREVKEEAGLTVTAVRYHSSQPWPFPSQLMIGLIAEVSDDQAAPDQTELEAVTWLTRAEARAVLDGAHSSIKAPPPFAIAHTLIRAWVDEG